MTELPCNHEPGVDCPVHPMTEENQRPVSAEEAAAIDRAVSSRAPAASGE